MTTDLVVLPFPPESLGISSKLFLNPAYSDLALEESNPQVKSLKFLFQFVSMTGNDDRSSDHQRVGKRQFVKGNVSNWSTGRLESSRRVIDTAALPIDNDIASFFHFICKIPVIVKRTQEWSRSGYDDD